MIRRSRRRPCSYRSPMDPDPQRGSAGRHVLRRVLCGVDGSPAGEEAVRQGARLRAPDGLLLLVSVSPGARAPHAQAALMLDRRAEAALQRAEREVGPAGRESHLLVGDPVGGLLAAARDLAATLIAVGSHGTGRMAGILTGSVATALLHRAPCSVLVARPPHDPAAFPARIAVGFDGSAPARAALEVARGLGERLGAEVVAVVAGPRAAAVPAPGAPAAVQVDAREPVEALLDAARGCDLVVVGARGVRGLRALGSVSERVAHRARSSVLVVRADRGAGAAGAGGAAPRRAG